MRWLRWGPLDGWRKIKRSDWWRSSWLKRNYSWWSSNLCSSRVHARNSRLRKKYLVETMEKQLETLQQEVTTWHPLTSKDDSCHRQCTWGRWLSKGSHFTPSSQVLWIFPHSQVIWLINWELMLEKVRRGSCPTSQEIMTAILWMWKSPLRLLRVIPMTKRKPSTLWNFHFFSK